MSFSRKLQIWVKSDWALELERPLMVCQRQLSYFLSLSLRKFIIDIAKSRRKVIMDYI